MKGRYMSKGVPFGNTANKLTPTYKLTDEEGPNNLRSVTGYYLGHKEIVTKSGPAVIHNFKTEAGIIGIWGKKNLNDNLIDSSEVKHGDKITVAFDKAVLTKKGSTAYLHSFTRYPGESIDPNEAYESSEEYLNDDSDEVEEEEAVAAPPPARAVRPSSPAHTVSAAQINSVASRLNQFKRS